MKTSSIATLLVALALLALSPPALAYNPAGNWHRSFPGGDHAVENCVVAHARHAVQDCIKAAQQPGWELQAQTVSVAGVTIVQFHVVGRVRCGNDDRPCPRAGGWLVATVIIDELTGEIYEWTCE